MPLYFDLFDFASASAYRLTVHGVIPISPRRGVSYAVGLICLPASSATRVEAIHAPSVIQTPIYDP